MALTSPGVEVTVIDESFYTPAEPGTTPLIVVATAQNKTNAAGALAAATTKANAGKAFRLTSQRDLVDLFGVPFFEKTASSTPIHGSERNEYGLLSAYSLLGVTNSVFMVRADVDLAQLAGRADAPGANPANGAWWVDTQATAWGIQEWNGAAVSTTGGQKFSSKVPLVLTDDDAGNKFNNNTGGPSDSVGQIGDYAVVFRASQGDVATIWYKSAGNTQVGVPAGGWVLVGSNEWCASHPAVVGGTVVTLANGELVLNNISIDVSTSDTVADLVAAINGAGVQGVSARAITGKVYLYTNGANDVVGDSTKSNAIVVGGTPAVLTSLGIAAGTYYGPALQQTPHTQVPQWKDSGTGQVKRPTGSVWIKTTEPNNGARWRVKKWNSATTSWLAVESPLYDSTHAAIYGLDRAGGGINLPVDSLFAQINADEHSGFDTDPATATFKMWRRAASGFTKVTSKVITTSTLPAGSVTFRISESRRGVAGLTSFTVSATLAGNDSDAVTLAGAINSLQFNHVEASVTDDGRLVVEHKAGGDFRMTAGTNNVVSLLFTGSDNFYELPEAASDDFIASNWQPFSEVDFAASGDAPLEEPVDGQLWYNPEFSDVDFMVHNGDTWVGLNSYAEYSSAQVIVAASQPELTNTQKAQNNHLWVSTADLENFPTIYRWSSNLQEWVQLDKTDQVTEDGVLFADARYGLTGATGNTAAPIAEYRTSNYLDPDAPDPALYPRGMLLWNLRRSGGNVKVYRNGYINTTLDNTRFDPLNTGGESMAAYAEDRWVTISGNNEDGSGSFGRKAQRKVVVQAMKSVVDTSQEIRDEERRNFNLIAAPGYPELLSNIVNLNIDRGLTAFVVGDTPLRLPADATSLTTWGTNANLVTDNGDEGIVTYDEYAAVFYPNGFTTDLGGANAVVPASHMMLRTITLSDSVSYPWFAPAGTRRGGITNATAVGYIDALSGEFQTVSLNEGQRDVLYDLKVNPITFFNGVGLVNYGQKTRARNASALDRINVARLVVYLRSQLQKLARPYVFEPNDKITRDEVKQAVESLLLELVGLRALYDFAVVCDESNNTPARIDRNELWVDIAIEPVKAIEFIYIPLRVKNTGEI
jgi:hypothetical protein